MGAVGHTGAEHFEEQLMLYHLGELSDADARSLEAHLPGCDRCRVMQAELCEVLGALAVLTGEREDLLTAYGFAAMPPPPADQARVLVAAAQSKRIAPAHRRRRRPGSVRRAMVTAGCVLVAVAGLGLAVRAVALDSAPPAPATVMSAAASAADRVTGAEMSVHLTEQEGEVAVRATVDRLTEGTAYRLFAEGAEGRRWPVADWTGTVGAQELAGRVPVPIAQLTHFTVERAADDHVTVAVYLPRAAGR